MKTVTNLTTMFSITLLATLMTGCGGGGGGSESSSPAPTVTQTTTQPAATTSAVTSEPQQTEPVQEPTATMEDFMPQSELKESAATDSTDLYVMPDFKFRTSDEVTMEFSGENVFGESLAGRTIKIYSFDVEVPSVEDELMGNKELVATLRFNPSGQLQHTLTLPQTAKTMLVRVDSMLETNQVLFPLDSDETIVHTFK
ncbi:hypothetical protein [Pseudoalteromonas luteoviolacea]|uniref:Uncharacterized protein n=1 Tax=Pseudoalteromonas luteoviolacea S4054 TaxID=1129367 RepID=A0A0F6AAH6_9GAMM|nr:hypothetical protein [Pseudoalteromonas luteoviolacea]AOT09446.1 hypothetical protein S4054249_17020 [Pseudoalteromonas luteoviolacea]AOT14358.1 hypothetical protein S40542_16990 [Pseudoalteromonas luteoviolacea]AOT19274.1 hypothetical protein S4054_16995 [Pseudoalteromonas luteoviolacea]KKE83158.1 hypothetical protein N479_15945 [Pseudoalteromonas luteoviolacea S4054]KZN73549.1 hypothetical protein N481_12610 [Pseudoalteromonas luteoviolacea S4047-1]